MARGSVTCCFWPVRTDCIPQAGHMVIQLEHMITIFELAQCFYSKRLWQALWHWGDTGGDNTFLYVCVLFCFVAVFRCFVNPVALSLLVYAVLNNMTSKPPCTPWHPCTLSLFAVRFS